MKTKIIISLMLIFSVNLLNAQLRVLSNGRVQSGLLKDSNEDLGNVTTMQLFGKNGDMRSGSKLSFGDFGQLANSGWNVFIGEYGSADTDQLWLHGKAGIYLTTLGTGANVVAYYNPSSNANFVFNTNIRVNGINITSDARLKQNVSSLQNSLGLLSKMNGVSYTYSLSEVQKNREQDESKFSETSKTETIGGLSSELQQANDAATSAKAIKDKQLLNEIEKREREDANRKRIGFLAQDIQKVLPELVQTDENGVLSIDYIGFIPLIVESLKEMQQTITSQQEEIDQLRTVISGEAASQLQPKAASNNNASLLIGAKLYNQDGASISYSLPNSFTNASLHIFDVTGKFIRNLSLTTNNGFVEINPSEIGYGTFIYTLVVDGQKADTLKKYISK